MGRSDKFWHLPLTAEFHHLYERNSERVRDEAIVRELLPKTKRHVIVDLGIGGGRELEWLKDIPGVEKIIGVDYSTHMLKKCINLWKRFEKKLILFDDDMRHLLNLKQIIKYEQLPCYYICLANTLGNLEKDEREQTLRLISALMKPGDRFIAVLYKLPLSREAWNAEIEYYKRNFPIYGDIIQRTFNSPIHYSYDIKERDVMFGTRDEVMCISHRWSKGEIRRMFKKTGFVLKDLIVGEYSYIPVGGPKNE